MIKWQNTYFFFFGSVWSILTTLVLCLFRYNRSSLQSRMDLPDFANRLWLRLRFNQHRVTWDFGFMTSCSMLKAPPVPLLA